MAKHSCTKEQFERDIATHAMEVKLNNGIHRHLRFARPECSSYHFSITTWPGYLCISGDMGCYVFSRLPDMFDFFRGEGINAGYWAEKVQSESRFGNGVMKFDQEGFMDGFKDRIDSYLENMDLTQDQRQQIIDLAAEEFCGISEDQQTHCDMANNFRFSDISLPEELEHLDFPDFEVDEFWSMEKFTFHYIWCLYAIVWAIDQFDKHMAAAPKTEAA